MYRIAKIKEQKSRDLDQVMCVKDEEGNVLVKDDNIKDGKIIFIICLMIEWKL